MGQLILDKEKVVKKLNKNILPIFVFLISVYTFNSINNQLLILYFNINSTKLRKNIYSNNLSCLNFMIINIKNSLF